MDNHSDIGAKARYEVGHIECTDRKVLVTFSQLETRKDHIRQLERLHDQVAIDESKTRRGLELYVSQAERRSKRNTRLLQTEIKRKGKVLNADIAKMVSLESMSWDAICQDATRFWTSFGSLTRLGRTMADIELMTSVRSAKLLATTLGRLLDLIVSGLTGYDQDQSIVWERSRKQLLLEAGESSERELTPVELYPGEVFWHIE